MGKGMQTDEPCFPENFMCIGGRPFAWVYLNRKEWVDFTRSWDKATGLFEEWRLYVLKKDAET
mgnify:CR=1 FL=1